MEKATKLATIVAKAARMEKKATEDEDLDSYDYLYSLLVNGNISLYKERLANMAGKEIVQYINWADEMGIDKAKLRLDLLK